MADKTPKVLIVGAGPTGLTAATELARLGIMPTLIERRSEPSELSRAVGIIPATMNILQACGAAKAIRAEAIPITAAIIHNRAKEVLRLPLDQGPAEMRILGLPQNRTETHLADSFTAQGGKILYGTELSDLQPTENGAIATFGTTTAHFDYVIGADGTHSKTRTAINSPYDGVDLPQEWTIADVGLQNWPDPTALKLYLKPEGVVAMVIPLEAARFRVVSNTPDALAALPVPITVTHLHRKASFTISVRQVPSYQSGQIFLAGDAAHCHSPVGGRGMNLGIADAAEIASRIASGNTDDYSLSRHSAGQNIIRNTERMRRIVTSKSRVTRALVLTALHVLKHLPALQKRAAKMMIT